MKPEAALAELTQFFLTQESLAGVGSNFSAMIQAQADDKSYVPKNFGSQKAVNDLDAEMVGKLFHVRQHRRVYNKLQQLPDNHLLTLVGYFQTENLNLAYRIAYQPASSRNTLETLAGLAHMTPAALQNDNPKQLCSSLMIPFNKEEVELKATIMKEAQQALDLALIAYCDLPEPAKKPRPKRKPEPAKPDFASQQEKQRKLKELTLALKDIIQ